MTRRYFGTDGIRGLVGQFPITPEFVLKLGWAAGRVLSREGHGKVLIGKDTRISGYMFESALEAGLAAAGCNVLLLGPMPTPAIAYLTRTFHADAGIVISASHNPFEDNGIKFFSGSGSKLADEIELAIEAAIDELMTMAEPALLGKARRVQDAAGRYIEFCKGTYPYDLDLKGLKLVLDCSHGATYHVAPAVFSELGAEIEVIGAEPDGLNINVDCGSTHPQALIDKVRETDADAGIAFDGDGDRVIMVDSDGQLLDGDQLLYIIASGMKSAGQSMGGVVGTLMSNLGFEIALRRLGIDFERANVGDRYVMERLKARGWLLGGESSGHIICLDRTTTGDGIVAALQVLAAWRRSEKALSELAREVTMYPQMMINVRLEQRIDPSDNPQIQAAVTRTETELGERGRVLLRASGTEPLIRVMIEGEDGEEVERLCVDLAEQVRAAVTTF